MVVLLTVLSSIAWPIVYIDSIRVANIKRSGVLGDRYFSRTPFTHKRQPEPEAL
jgi:hypothetical protein